MNKQRIVFSTPYKVDYSFVEAGQDWFKPFLLSTMGNVDLTEEMHSIEVNTSIYNQWEGADEKDVDMITGQLILNQVVTVPYSRLMSGDGVRFGDALVRIVQERSKTKEQTCNLGILIFKNDPERIYDYIVLLVAQDSKNFDDINVNFAQMGFQYQDENNNPFIKHFGNFDTALMPLESVLDFVYRDRPDLDSEGKFQLALDALFKQHHGLNHSFVYDRYAVGVSYQHKLIDEEKKIYQKVGSGVHYMVFGNRITFEFDISEAPKDPKDLQFQSWNIKVEQIRASATEIDQDYLQSCIPSAFEIVKKHYLVNDLYYKKLAT